MQTNDGSFDYTIRESKKKLFNISDESCEHGEVTYELRPRGGAWGSVYDADAVKVKIEMCALTGTECISEYKFDCPRYANAMHLLKERQSK